MFVSCRLRLFRLFLYDYSDHNSDLRLSIWLSHSLFRSYCHLQDIYVELDGNTKWSVSRPSAVSRRTAVWTDGWLLAQFRLGFTQLVHNRPFPQLCATLTFLAYTFVNASISGSDFPSAIGVTRGCMTLILAIFLLNREATIGRPSQLIVASFLNPVNISFGNNTLNYRPVHASSYTTVFI